MDNRHSSSPSPVMGAKTVLSDSMLSSPGCVHTPSSGGSTFDLLLESREKGSREADGGADKEAGSALLCSAASDDMFSMSGDADSLIFMEALALAEEFATLAKEADEPAAESSGMADSWQRLTAGAAMLASGVQPSAAPAPAPPGPVPDVVPVSTAALPVSTAYAALCEKASAELRQLELQTQEEYESLQFEAAERLVAAGEADPGRHRPLQLIPWGADAARPATGGYGVDGSWRGTYRVLKPSVGPCLANESPSETRRRRSSPAPPATRHASGRAALDRTFRCDARPDRTDRAEAWLDTSDGPCREQRELTGSTTQQRGDSPLVTAGRPVRRARVSLNQTWDVDAPDSRASSALGRVNSTFDTDVLNKTFDAEGPAIASAGANGLLNSTYDAEASLQGVFHGDVGPDLTQDAAGALNQTFDASVRSTRKSGAYRRLTWKSDVDAVLNRTFDGKDSWQREASRALGRPRA
ncbi:uncharacterized protein LOC119113112 isoform X2 [Pollicipes pollicipes]|nr:uncharacterized protein LOC119113112 isoform X2 [Pollicipes pollicipes]XP_037093343.1 uncharacterized protein LOC119113112 isoform X2 [Pollicipes pollicipes]XP_037093344.1 uncharacterized protein LOC119113112 isoform X2 [Pollicipes pollicipes]XP_037093345.1 uncharacterized protein LOC119113112 isoform X2 [Pollicipes pollicipes]